jgi:PadR family transcriptional regulator PadR
MADFKKQLNKGIFELAILNFLTTQDHYGYSLIQEIKGKSKETIDIKDGTLYPILYRLEDQGYIQSYWQEADGRGKPRKYYKITTKGRARFDQMLVDYLEVTKGIQYILSSNEVDYE